MNTTTKINPSGIEHLNDAMQYTTEQAPATQPVQLLTALAAVRSELGHMVSRDGKNPHFNSKFVSLAGAMKVVRPVLDSRGLVDVQDTSTAHDGSIAITTTLIHLDSGEARSFGTLTMPISRKDAQAAGSALTYARRYSLLTALGLAPEDDDAERAAGRSHEMATDEMIAKLDRMMARLIEIDENAADYVEQQKDAIETAEGGFSIQNAIDLRKRLTLLIERATEHAASMVEAETTDAPVAAVNAVRGSMSDAALEAELEEWSCRGYDEDNHENQGDDQ